MKNWQWVYLAGLILAIIALCSCVKPPPKEKPTMLIIPPMADFDRPIVPFKVKALLIFADPISGEEGSKFIQVPAIADFEPVVCFDLPSHHAWQCLFRNPTEDTVTLQSFIPTEENL